MIEVILVVLLLILGMMLLPWIMKAAGFLLVMWFTYMFWVLGDDEDEGY